MDFLEAESLKAGRIPACREGTKHPTRAGSELPPHPVRRMSVRKHVEPLTYEWMQHMQRRRQSSLSNFLCIPRFNFTASPPKTAPLPSSHPSLITPYTFRRYIIFPLGSLTCVRAKPTVTKLARSSQLNHTKLETSHNVTSPHGNTVIPNPLAWP